jgi:hypothetical protein
MTRLDFLRDSQNPDGGWGYFPGRDSRPEPTAYAMRALGINNKGIECLLKLRQSDGGFAAAEGIAGSTWVTQLVLPLLVQAKVDRRILEQASAWIVGTEGAESALRMRLALLFTKNVIEQDPKLRAWPWRAGNNSWVEPTAQGLLALGWMNGFAPEAAIRYRRDMAVKMMLDRRCADGGWNYGNKKVLGETLPSYPETTGIALTGLVGTIEINNSLEAARRMLQGNVGAYARAWLTIGLRCHGQRVDVTGFGDAVHPSRNVLLAALEALAVGELKGVFTP